MQDNLARELQEPYVKPNLKVHVNPHTERIAVIRSTIDALYDIRLSLSVKKILGPFIKRYEFEQMVEEVKEKVIDQKVKDEIDKALGEYMTSNKNDSVPQDINKSIMQSGKDIWDNNKPIAISEVENKIDEAIDGQKSEGYSQADQRGPSMVKSTRYFKNSNDDLRTS